MGETASQIENFIENKREDLGANLAELQNKVKSATDWRGQFRNNPMMMVGVAFGGGILLSSLMGGGRSRHRSSGSGRHFNEGSSSSSSSTPHAGTERQAHQAFETWDNIKGALIGVAATRFKDYVGEFIPGFHEQFRKTEMMKGSSSSSSSGSGSVRSVSPTEQMARQA